MGHLKTVILKEVIQQLFPSRTIGAEGHDVGGNLLGGGDVEIGKRRNVLGGCGVTGDIDLGTQLRQLAKSLQIGRHIVDKAHAVLLNSLLRGQAIGDESRAVGQQEAHLMEEVTTQRENLHLSGETGVGKGRYLAGLCHQELVAQLLVGKTTVEEGGLKLGIGGHRALHAAGKHRAVVLLLQVGAAAHMVGVGMGHQNAAAAPALRVQFLTGAAACVLIRAAVNEIDLIAALGAIDADFGGALQIIALRAYLTEFIHTLLLLYSNASRLSNTSRIEP